MGSQVPIVDYLVLDDGAPHLVAHACKECGALYFDRRNACAKCGKTAFGSKKLGDKGTVKAYTIVARAAPNVKVPYVSAIVDLEGGGTVKGNLVDIDPDPAQLKFGMPLRMVFRGADSASAEGAGHLAHFFVPA
jgi:uncharacterized OB-fold protein